MLSFSCFKSLIECSCCQDKSISGFISYALCAADEALKVQIGCLQKMRRKKERYQLLLWKLIFLLYMYLWAVGIWLELYQGVSIGGGIGSISNILDASQMTLKMSVSLLLHLSFLVANFILVAIHMWWWCRCDGGRWNRVHYRCFVYMWIWK